MIYLTGDTHGDFNRFSSLNWSKGAKLTKKDFVIILGDFGGVWTVNPDNKKKENYWLDWLNQKPWTTLFLDGNHENFDIINSLPEFVDKEKNIFGKVRDSLFHLKRGFIYNLDNTKFFIFGGAESIDKNQRKEYTSWWKEELPSKKEYDKGLKTLSKNKKVDYILSHTAPNFIRKIIFPTYFEMDQLGKYFDYLVQVGNIEFKHWYFGHFHINKTIRNKYTCLYKNIIKLN